MFKKIFKWGGLALSLFAIGVFTIAATKPDSFQVQRTITINAPQQAVHELVNDYRNWTAWSPWEKKDPTMKRTFNGRSAARARSTPGTATARSARAAC
jgi:hypothetical protein